MKIVKSPTKAYVIMWSSVGINANGEHAKLIEPLLVYKNEHKARIKLKELLLSTDDKYWIWETPWGKL